jgi:predicted nucleic acid-binding Zn ribbon protein
MAAQKRRAQLGKNGHIQEGRMKRGGPAESVGQVMPRLLKHLKIDAKINEHRGILGWRESVGETVARRTETLCVRRGTLWVAVENSVWMQELSARRKEILERLATYAGRGTIRDIRFVMKGSEGDYGKEEG